MCHNYIVLCCWKDIVSPPGKRLFIYTHCEHSQKLLCISKIWIGMGKKFLASWAVESAPFGTDFFPVGRWTLFPSISPTATSSRKDMCLHSVWCFWFFSEVIKRKWYCHDRKLNLQLSFTQNVASFPWKETSILFPSCPHLYHFIAWNLKLTVSNIM